MMRFLAFLTCFLFIASVVLCRKHHRKHPKVGELSEKQRRQNIIRPDAKKSSGFVGKRDELNKAEFKPSGNVRLQNSDAKNSVNNIRRNVLGEIKSGTNKTSFANVNTNASYNNQSSNQNNNTNTVKNEIKNVSNSSRNATERGVKRQEVQSANVFNKNNAVTGITRSLTNKNLKNQNNFEKSDRLSKDTKVGDKKENSSVQKHFKPATLLILDDNSDATNKKENREKVKSVQTEKQSVVVKEKKNNESDNKNIVKKGMRNTKAKLDKPTSKISQKGILQTPPKQHENKNSTARLNADSLSNKSAEAFTKVSTVGGDSSIQVDNEKIVTTVNQTTGTKQINISPTTGFKEMNGDDLLQTIGFRKAVFLKENPTGKIAENVTAEKLQKITENNEMNETNESKSKENSVLKDSQKIGSEVLPKVQGGTPFKLKTKQRKNTNKRLNKNLKRKPKIKSHKKRKNLRNFRSGEKVTLHHSLERSEDGERKTLGPSQSMAGSLLFGKNGLKSKADQDDKSLIQGPDGHGNIEAAPKSSQYPEEDGNYDDDNDDNDDNQDDDDEEDQDEKEDRYSAVGKGLNAHGRPISLNREHGGYDHTSKHYRDREDDKEDDDSDDDEDDEENGARHHVKNNDAGENVDVKNNDVGKNVDVKNRNAGMENVVHKGENLDESSRLNRNDNGRNDGNNNIDEPRHDGKNDAFSNYNDDRKERHERNHDGDHKEQESFHDSSRNKEDPMADMGIWNNIVGMNIQRETNELDNGPQQRRPGSQRRDDTLLGPGEFDVSGHHKRGKKKESILAKRTKTDSKKPTSQKQHRRYKLSTEESYSGDFHGFEPDSEEDKKKTHT